MIFKCKACGATLDIIENQNIVICDYCGTHQTMHDINDNKRNHLFNRANEQRLNCEFDKAAGLYEALIAELPTEAEAYWGLILCKYGIEYVIDPKTKKRIPTCHRTQFSSIYDDIDYKSAIKYAKEDAKKIYEDEAKIISNLQKNILDISSKEEPFDVFICYKETDNYGQRTKDSVIAQKIYDELIEKDLKVFFSRITLEDKLGVQYEPYIFAALNSAKVMIHVTSSLSNTDATWVRNEWSRFLSFIVQGQKKHFIPCTLDVNMSELPIEMSNIQGQDLTKVGAIQDLVRGVKKLVGKSNKTIVNNNITNTYNIDGETTNRKMSPTSLKDELFHEQLNKGDVYLESGMYEEAIETYNKALKLSKTPGEVEFKLLLANNKSKNKNELLEKYKNNLNDLINKLSEVVPHSDNAYAKKINNIIDEVNKKVLIDALTNLIALTNDKKFKEIQNLINTFSGDKQVLINEYLDARVPLLDNNSELYEYDELLEFLDDYKDKYNLNKYLKIINNKMDDKIYSAAKVKLNSINGCENISLCDEVISSFEEIIDYKDTKELIEKAKNLKSQLLNKYTDEFINNLRIEYGPNTNIDTYIKIIEKLIKNSKAIKENKYNVDTIKKEHDFIVEEALLFLKNNDKQFKNIIDECLDLEKLKRYISEFAEVVGVYKINPLTDYAHYVVARHNKLVKQAKKKQKIIKLSAITSIIAIVVASITITIAVNNHNIQQQYSIILNQITNKDYDNAINKLIYSNYENNKQLLYMCYAGQNFDDGKYEEGINCINYIGGDVSVIYNADGGTLEKNEEVIYGKKSAYINNNWEKEDCLFNGWRLDTYTLDIYEYNASITLSPIYEQISNTN